MDAAFLPRTWYRLASAVAAVLTAASMPVAAGEPPATFTDVAAETGLDFVHFNGMSGELYFPEMTGAGGALADFDGDGDLDVYLVQGTILGPGKTLADARPPYRGEGEPTDRLFRNDLAPGPEGVLRPHFVDVTAGSGIPSGSYGMGAATGDFDNDGRIDLYLTSYGPNRLLRNLGPGPGGQITFEDVTAASGSDDPRWSVSATFFDYDRDGWLDLYVVNYLAFSLVDNPHCYAPSSRRDYCGPAAFKGQGDRLLRNLGPGPGGQVRFADVTAQAGIAHATGKGLGVVAADLDGNGWPDLYVANDGEANFLWLNQRDGTFRDDALFAGAALNAAGLPEASMGVDAGDVDNDGDEDLFSAHLAGESNTLYVNQGGGLFEDRTAAFDLVGPSLPFTSFGTAFFDFDNDGWLDLLLANGAVRILEDLVQAGDPYPLDQTNQLLRNLDGRRFADVTASAGPAFRLAEVSRGAAFGDVDNDGDTDVLLCNNSGPVRLLRNDAGNSQGWLGLRLIGRGATGATAAAERDLFGTRVELRLPGRPTLWRRVHSDGSYASASDPRLLFGLGPRPATPEPLAVRVHWPDGAVEPFDGLAADRYHTLRQGTGRTEPPPAPPQPR